MASLNKVMLIGNLGADPEVKTTPTGKTVATFRIATTETYKDQSSNTVERTEWHRIVVWERLAEICQQYLTKGKQVYIEGRIQTRSWDDKETGQKRYMTEINANTMQMLGSKGNSSTRTEDSSANAPTKQSNNSEDSKDDLPF